MLRNIILFYFYFSKQQVKAKDAMIHHHNPELNSSSIYSDGDIGSSDSLSLAGLGSKADYDRSRKKK